MGVIKRGILGGFSGKVANVVGSSWKGIAYMKSMPLSVANPQTTAQTTQRNAFGKTVEIAGAILADWVKPLWDRFAQGMSGYNAFVQANVGLCPDGVFVPNNFIMSRGALYKGEIVSVIGDNSSNTITYELTTALGPNGLATDLIYLMVFNATQNYWIVEAGSYDRGQDAYVITDDQMGTGDQMYTWLAYRRLDGTMVSDSSMEAFVVVA